MEKCPLQKTGRAAATHGADKGRSNSKGVEEAGTESHHKPQLQHSNPQLELKIWIFSLSSGGFEPHIEHPQLLKPPPEGLAYTISRSENSQGSCPGNP